LWADVPGIDLRRRAGPDEHPRRVAIDGVRASALRAALVDGENSGPSTEFDFDDFLGRMRVKEIAEAMDLGSSLPG